MSTVEGVLAEWVSVCAGGGTLVAWALCLDTPPALVALLAALPAFAQSVHLPAARLTARLGARRTAIVAALAARQPYALLVVLPWLPLGTEGRQVVLVTLAALAAALAAISQHAWLAWTTALFRAPIRARVLARRSGRVTLAGSVGALAVGALLDRCAGESRIVALATLAAVAWLSGIASTAVLARQHAPRAVRQPREGPVCLREALAGASARRGLGFICAWNAALGITAAASALFMLQQLHFGFLPIAMHGIAVAAAAAVAAPLWARLVDRTGVAHVLVMSALGAAALPFLWLAASDEVLWPIAVDAVLGGVLLGGQGVATSNLPMAVAPQGRRAEVLATYSTAAGLAFAAASVTCVWLTAKLPWAFFVGDDLLVVRKLVFAAGGTARLGAAALAAGVFRREQRSR